MVTVGATVLQEGQKDKRHSVISTAIRGIVFIGSVLGLAGSADKYAYSAVASKQGQALAAKSRCP